MWPPAVSYTQLDVYKRQNKQSILGGSAFVTPKPMLRAAGHRIADMIYEKLTGEPGIFSTRVAYVVRASATRYELSLIHI